MAHATRIVRLRRRCRAAAGGDDAVRIDIIGMEGGATSVRKERAAIGSLRHQREGREVALTTVYCWRSPGCCWQTERSAQQTTPTRTATPTAMVHPLPGCKVFGFAESSSFPFARQISPIFRHLLQLFARHSIMQDTLRVTLTRLIGCDPRIEALRPKIAVW